MRMEGGAFTKDHNHLTLWNGSDPRISSMESQTGFRQGSANMLSACGMSSKVLGSLFNF